jgi:general secretion pathway protein A
MINEMLSYFNMTEMPFGKEIKTESLILLPSFDSALASAQLLVSTRGIGIITGKSGTGKSCLIRFLISGLNTGLYMPVYICHSTVSLIEFYSHVACKLGIEGSMRKAMLFRNIKNRIISLNKSSRIHPILIIDEAHLLRNDILVELRLLSNFEIDSFNALSILLCGQEGLKLKFGLTILESLANSITISIPMEGLKEEETFTYIEGRVKAVGNSNPLFTKSALKLIHQSSGGIFRAINNISRAALFKAFSLKTQTVEAEHVKMVISR